MILNTLVSRTSKNTAMPQQTDEERAAWVADHEYWRDIPLPEKTLRIITAINESESRAAAYAALKKSARYPFTHDGSLPDQGSAICILAGRINLPTGKLAEWQIWSSQHSVDIIFW